MILKYNQLTAAAWAYDDAFIICTVLCLIVALLVFLYRKPASKPQNGSTGAVKEEQHAVEAG